MSPQSSFMETCLVVAHMQKHDPSSKLPVKTSSLEALEGSCSGIVLDTHHGLILTHATLLLPLVNALGEDVKADVNALKLLLPHVTCKVVLEEMYNYDCHAKKNTRQGRKPYFTALMNITTNHSTPQKDALRTPQRRLKQYKATVRHMFPVASFADALTKLMPPSEGWRFADESPDKSSTQSMSISEPEQLQSLLSHFFVLQLDDWVSQNQEPPKIYPSNRLHLGDPVIARSTPFGVLSAPVFMNSLSKGVISNLAGADNCLLLTDARCIPGGEGGAIYWGSDVTSMRLVGAVVASLCWKLNEWMGLTVACSMYELLNTLAQERGYDLIPMKQRVVKDNRIHHMADEEPVVFLVQCGTNWGSGVLIDPTRGFVLTCSHVIKSADRAPVHISYKRGTSKLSAETIYQSPSGAVYDIALLRVTPPPEWKSLPQPSVGQPTEGDNVRVVGHGCFGAGHQMSPSVFQGIVSKVLHVRESPILIQSSCAVHAGASGGALVDNSGNIIGIVACNARDTSSGASYPHVNMSIPVCALWPVIQEYIETDDEACLRHLVTGDPDVVKLWSLKLAEFKTSVSKL